MSKYDDLYAQGFSVDDIAKAFRLPISTIRRNMDNPPKELSAGTAIAIIGEEGLSIKQICRKYNADRNKVKKLLENTSDSLHRDAEQSEILAYYLTQDVSVHECARKFGITPNSLKLLLHQNKMPMEDKGSKQYKRHKVGAMLEKGMKPADIAEQLNIKITTVYKYASDAGYSSAQKHINRTEEDWVKILKHANEFGVTSASRTFNVTRGAIYKRKNKDDRSN